MHRIRADLISRAPALASPAKQAAKLAKAEAAAATHKAGAGTAGTFERNCCRLLPAGKNSRRRRRLKRQRFKMVFDAAGLRSRFLSFIWRATRRRRANVWFVELRCKCCVCRFSRSLLYLVRTCQLEELKQAKKNAAEAVEAAKKAGPPKPEVCAEISQVCEERAERRRPLMRRRRKKRS